MIKVYEKFGSIVLGIVQTYSFIFANLNLWFLMRFVNLYQIQRFCPTAPGSGLVTGPTYQKDPDPGHYYSEKKWNDLKYLDKTIQKYRSKEHKDLAVVPHGKAPSIPTKKLAATAYTHKGFDKVGPAGYNPKVPTVKQ